MSWHDIGTTRGPIFMDATKAYTSVWNGSWATPFEHRANGNPMMDQYLYWDAVHARWSHVALDYGSQASCIRSITRGPPTEVAGVALRSVARLRPRTNVQQGSRRTFT